MPGVYSIKIYASSKDSGAERTSYAQGNAPRLQYIFHIVLVTMGSLVYNQFLRLKKRGEQDK